MPRLIVIDGARFNDLEGFWDEVARAWGTMPPGFGRNVDAFEELVNGASEPTVVRWLEAGRSREKLGHEATVRWLEQRLPKVHASNRAEFSKRLEHARAGRGETVFDMLVDVLQVAPRITLELTDGR